jgi:hypothetical protein
MDGPFCVDCRNYRSFTMTGTGACRRPIGLSVVTGKMLHGFESCRWERSRSTRGLEGRCGPEGRFFEAKDKT